MVVKILLSRATRGCATQVNYNENDYLQYLVKHLLPNDDEVAVLFGYNCFVSELVCIQQRDISKMVTSNFRGKAQEGRDNECNTTQCLFNWILEISFKTTILISILLCQFYFVILLYKLLLHTLGLVNQKHTCYFKCALSSCT